MTHQDTIHDLICDLCREAGDSVSDDNWAEIVEGWYANHSECCGGRIEQAADRDAGALIAVRICMGLPLTK